MRLRRFFGATGNPGPSPLIRPFGRHLEQSGDHDRRLTIGGYPRRLLPNLLSSRSFCLVNAAVIAVSHATSRPTPTR
ncbi:hypothetical protein SAMN05421748_109282 [Paractinoplanes atraurantiacus]|uniref:Uncharacterized protein n=1 Tax=Paractinoplanes atraurantiacus TaxID=1036182 RepID=A0A285IQQ3_9ACTN|nr:hypothetical protein [Actinoplanes atraurantiacus]SNY49291.1 hypothetical protein SAMN05421748_109282 [Actinoplanes atraurantiacus]